MEQLMDMHEISRHRDMTVNQRYSQRYAAANIRYATEVISWLVRMKRTSNLVSGVTEEPNCNGWWFDWRKIHLIGGDVCDYCSSKRRKLKNGKIVNERIHNILRYKTAVSHCLKRYQSSNPAASIDFARVEKYRLTVGEFFDGIKKQENELKAQGLIPLDTGGDVFSFEFYKDISKRLLAAGDFRSALINHAGLHTAGRMGNIGGQTITHFRLKNDCIQIQFPLVKNDNRGVFHSFALKFFWSLT